MSEIKDVFFECNKCKNRFYINQLIELFWDHEDDIADIAEEKNMEFWEIMSPSSSDDMFKGFGGNIIDFQFSNKICNCDVNHQIEIYVEFIYNTPYWQDGKYTYYVQQIEDFIPLISKTMKIKSEFLLMEGLNVLNLLHWFIERWVALEYDIEIVSPFLDQKACWDPLFETVLKFRNRNHNLKDFSFFTRKTHGFFKNQKSIQQQIDDWLSAKSNYCKPDFEFSETKCFGNLTYPCIHNYAPILISNINYTKKRFHAKYYIGSNDHNKEVIISSYNLINSELNQYETFYLTDNIANAGEFKNSLKWDKVIPKI